MHLWHMQPSDFRSLLAYASCICADQRALDKSGHFKMDCLTKSRQMCREKIWILCASPSSGSATLLLSLAVSAPPQSGMTQGAGRGRHEPNWAADSKEPS